MNILQITSGGTVNGALVYCKLLSQRLAARGHSVSIMHRPGSWIESQFDDSPVNLIPSNLARIPRELKRISNYIREHNIDLVHTHMSRAHSFGVILKMLAGIPSVATAHSRQFQIHWCMNDFVIANSGSTRNFQRNVNRVPDHKLEMVHCFSDLKRFDEVTKRKVTIVRRQMRLKGDEFLIGIVGDVHNRKGHTYLFRALTKIVARVPNAKLVVLGRFHRDEQLTKSLRKIVIEDGLFKRTKWLGLRNNVEDFMTAFDLVVVPSIEEPLGLVAIESLAAGTPVVAADVGGLPEIIQHEQTGLLVPPRDPDAIANAVIRMANDKELRNRCGETGRQMVLEKFDVDALTDRVVDIYHRVVSRRIAA